MKLTNHTFESPTMNLSCDEAILEMCEKGFDEEILRFWEPSSPFVVLGYTNKFHLNVDSASCATHGIPIHRRCSGGGTVLQLPKSLNFSLILNKENRDGLNTIQSTTRTVLEKNRRAVQNLVHLPVDCSGISDLTIRNLKFSGNAQRRKKKYVLFHGTFLLNADLSLIDLTLLHPPDEPGYRARRSHRDFLTNLHCPATNLIDELTREWNVDDTLDELPLDEIERLALNRYSDSSWITRL